MPTRNVNLTGEFDSLVLANVASGRYENASEVVRATLQSGPVSWFVEGQAVTPRARCIGHSLGPGLPCAPRRF